MSDETVQSIVRFVEAAETYASIFNVPVSVAAHMLLKSWQITAKMQAGGLSALVGLAPKGTVQ